MKTGAKTRAIALLSGGLDSLLAARVIKDLGFEILGIGFYNGFSARNPQEVEARLWRAAAQLEVEVELIDIREEFLKIVKHPRHGYGSALNPCIDCRILMFSRAKELLEERRAEFVVSGEILGQRPMSQHHRALMTVAAESGLGTRLLRPLSGRLLPPTYPEEQGWLTRDELYDIQGRSRRRQLELARRFGITEYLQPAGGCLLTDRPYAARVRDAFTHEGKDSLTYRDFELLIFGRLFRLSPLSKALIGRNERENDHLARLAPQGSYRLEVLDHPGPLAVVLGQPSVEDLKLAAQITARYSDGRGEAEVRVLIQRGEETQILEVSPLSPADGRLERARVG